MKLEGLSHKLGDARTLSAKFSGDQNHWWSNRSYPQTTTSSNIVPHNRATVELSFDP